jgi:DNA-binding MarR family transcriptional regulator
MADMQAGATLLYLREEELRLGVEMMFYAQRDLAAALDGALDRNRIGRAHHRALYFIGRNPHISVGGLLEILRITKQSLSRVLGEMLAADLVHQRAGRRDRRQRLLTLTPRGAEIERELFEIQRARLLSAYRAAGGPAVLGFREVLSALIDEPMPTNPPTTG